MKSVHLLVLGWFFLSACGGPPNPFDKSAGLSGHYLGTLELKFSNSTEESQEVITIEASSDSDADAYLSSTEIPCGTIPLKKSGSSLELDRDFECQTTTSINDNGTTSTIGGTYTITKLEVDGSDNSIEVEARWEYRARNSTGTSTTDAEFSGDRIAAE